MILAFPELAPAIIDTKISINSSFGSHEMILKQFAFRKFWEFWQIQPLLENKSKIIVIVRPGFLLSATP